MSSSLPIAAFLNRNPQTFGGFIGKWVMVRNFFEYGIHIVTIRQYSDSLLAEAGVKERLPPRTTDPEIGRAHV